MRPKAHSGMRSSLERGGVTSAKLVRPGVVLSWDVRRDHGPFVLMGPGGYKLHKDL